MHGTGSGVGSGVPMALVERYLPTYGTNSGGNYGTGSGVPMTQVMG